MKKRSPAGNSSESALKKWVTCEPCTCQSQARSCGKLKRRSRRTGIMAFLLVILYMLLNVLNVLNVLIGRSAWCEMTACASGTPPVHLRGAARALFRNALHAALLHPAQRLVGRRQRPREPVGGARVAADQHA